MRSRRDGGRAWAPLMDERRLKLLLAVFFVALAIPSVVLLGQAYRQLKWESFRQTEVLAEDLAARIDADLRAAVVAEEARSFGDYAFLVVEGDASANFVQRSALSSFPVESAVPGAIGYFQVDANGQLTTPLLPKTGVDAARYGISSDERRARLGLETSIRDVLIENRLVQRPALTEPAALNTFVDYVTSGRGQTRVETIGRGVQSDAEGDPSSRSNDVSISRAVATAAESAAPAVLAGSGAQRETSALPPQAAFDRLKAVDEIAGAERGEATSAPPSPAVQLDESVISASRINGGAAPLAGNAVEQPARLSRTEQALVAEPSEQETNAIEDQAAPTSDLELRVRMFESELEPFEVGLLDTGHLVLFRSAWREGARYIQGILVDRERFVAQTVDRVLEGSSLAGVSTLVPLYGGQPLGGGSYGAAGSVLETGGGRAAAAYQGGAGLGSSLLHRARMSPPFGNLELVFTVDQLPRATGSALLGWVSVILTIVLCGGFVLMYRFAAGQVRLTRQQQDFVSAVSHELKTPLTSIRMYGEMLKAGWADEARKQVYYDYIHGEAERLSRLIENVLQLARLTKHAPQLNLRQVSSSELFDLVQSKVGTQVERAGFRLELRNDASDATLTLDPDCFIQVVINLVDNALKFAASAERKVIEIACRRDRDGDLLVTVRDFGPGIAKGQMKRIFTLFYRPEDKLTRETIGTGIGLALVQQLVTALGGRVEARNCSPGAELRLTFPLVTTRRTFGCAES